MPSSLIEYRLRIRNASTVLNPNGTADALVLSSVRSGENPYIAAPPSGDGLEFDPIRGTVRSGSYTVLVSDVLTSGTSRVVTSQLVDAQNRQQLLSRRAYLEFRVDSGSWQTLLAGYVLGVRLATALSYQFTIGDSRRIEQTKNVFIQDDAFFRIRGAILGGPILNAADIANTGLGPFVDRGGWKFRISAVNGTVCDLEFVEGYNGPYGRTSNKWGDVTKSIPAKAGYLTYIDEIASAYVDPTPQVYSGISGSVYRYPNLVLKVYNSGTLYANATPVSVVPGLTSGFTGGFGSYAKAHLRADFAGGSTPPVGAILGCSLITRSPSERSPLYVSSHPVDIVRNLYKSVGIPIDESSFNALKTLQGDYYRYTMRVVEPRRLSEVLEELAGPFGIGLRVSTTGEVQAFSSRIKTTVLPTVQVDTSGLRGEGANIFDLEESTVVTSVTMEAQTFGSIANLNTDSVGDVPLDGIVVSKESITYDNADVSTFSSKEIKYTLNGMIHGSNWYGSQLPLFIIGVAGEIFDRYGRGAVGGELQCLRGVAGVDGIAPGDEIYVNVAQLPNNGKRLGDDPSVGARIMQVVRRTETPSGPDLRLLDSGSAAQPAFTPVLSVGASSSAPATTVTVTFVNASSLNASGYTVAIEYAIAATQPSGNGTVFTRYTPGTVPAGAISLPPAPPGSNVWVRARTEVALARPSAWTSWQGVTLSALAGPSSLAVAVLRQTAVTLSWANTSSALPIEMFVAPTAAAASLTDPKYRVALLPPASTQFTYRLLEGPGVGYVAGARYALPDGNGSTVATVSFTTTSTSDTAYRPAGIAAIQPVDATVLDSSTRQGIAIALWSNNQVLDLEIQRAPDVAGVPGTQSTVGRVPGSTTVYTDYSLPDTSASYWYRVRHVLGGYDATAYTCWKQATVGAVPQDVQRPSAIVPVVVPSFSESATSATVTLTITDPQCRVDLVRFRNRLGGTWSVWTVVAAAPYTYTQTIPETGFIDIEYQVLGFDAAGTYGTVAGETVSFDRNQTSDMVSVVGTFDSTGQFVLAITGDSDTASVRYATSTSSQPTLATTQAQTAVNSRNLSTTLPGPYASNATVYVSVLGYTAINGGGTESVLFEYRFTRDGGLLYTQCLARMGTSTATSITVTVTGTAATGTPTVQLVAVTGSAVLSSGAAIGTAVPSGSSWTFTRGAALGEPGGAQFRSVLAGAQSDDDFIEIPEQGRDTTYLATRARVLSTSSTTVVVRVAVLDKYTALLCSLSYIATGVGTVTPSGAQSVTAAVGDTFPAEVVGQYVDFTIARPAFGSGTGRVTFTASATNRVADSDGVDIPAIERDTVALASRVRVTSTTATTITVRMAVADPYPQGTDSATITYSVVGLATPTQTGGGALPSPITVTPAATLTEAAGTFYDFLVTRPSAGSPPGRITLTATAATRTETTGSATIPAQDLVGPSLQVSSTPGPSSYSIAYTYDGTLTLSIDGGAYGAAPSSPIVVSRGSPGSNAKTYSFRCVKDGQTVSNEVLVPAQELVGPSLNVVTSPGASSYVLVITYDGTVSYALDGVAQSTAGWTSPYTLTISRNDYLGATKVVSLSVAKDGATVSQTVNVPAKDNNAGASISIGTQSADNTTNTYTFSWSASGMPAGTTYDLIYQTTSTSGVVQNGALSNQTSPVNVAAGISIGTSPKYSMTVNAICNGVLIFSKSRAGTFLV